MSKRMEDMTRAEILAEFEGGEKFTVPRRAKKLVHLTVRVHPDLLRELGREAERRGVLGHTTAARLLIEEGLRRSQHEFAREVAREVVKELKKRKKAV